MRIITGTARGMALTTLDGEMTRPTLAKVKEALFSAIQFDIELLIHFFKPIKTKSNQKKSKRCLMLLLQTFQFSQKKLFLKKMH